jgi:hypothetical protein
MRFQRVLRETVVKCPDWTWTCDLVCRGCPTDYSCSFAATLASRSLLHFLRLLGNFLVMIKYSPDYLHVVFNITMSYMAHESNTCIS